VGERYAKILANHFRSIDKLAAASVEELDDIPEIGLTVAVSVYEWFRNPLHIELLDSPQLLFFVGHRAPF